MIRNLEGSEEGEVNTICISANGDYLISGGQDKILKLWNYDEGEIIYEGIGHSSAINRSIISPDQKNIVTIGNDGSIIVWNVPEELENK